MIKLNRKRVQGVAFIDASEFNPSLSVLPLSLRVRPPYNG